MIKEFLRKWLGVEDDFDSLERFIQDQANRVTTLSTETMSRLVTESHNLKELIDRQQSAINHLKKLEEIHREKFEGVLKFLELEAYYLKEADPAFEVPLIEKLIVRKKSNN